MADYSRNNWGEVNYFMGFREWLRELLKRGAYRNQYDMADAFHVQQSAVNHWLQGRHRPNLDSCGLISKATGKPLADIYQMVGQDAQV